MGALVSPIMDAWQFPIVACAIMITDIKMYVSAKRKVWPDYPQIDSAYGKVRYVGICDGRDGRG